MDHPEKDIQYWENVSDSYLRNSMLRDISKTLPLRTTAKRTLALYLRWLEIHRCSDSKTTNHWENTLMHWTQALRARGFTEVEVYRGVKQWRDSSDYKVGEGRSMPSWEDVQDVYGKRGLTDLESEEKCRVEMARAEKREEKRERRREEDRERERFDWRSPVNYGRKEKLWQQEFEDKYTGTPYPGYICKRCGGGGHHLQACPTNLDPSWDAPPESDYECTLCGAHGEHYKSLCPRNTDPNCLNQKRKRAGVITPEKEHLANWDHPRSREHPDRIPKAKEADYQRDLFRYSPTTSNPTLRRQQELFGLDQTRNRLLAEDQFDPLRLSPATSTSRRQQELFALDQKRDRLLAENQTNFTRPGTLKMTSEHSSSPAPLHRKRAREHPSNEDNFGRLSLSGSSSSPEESRKRVRFSEPTSPPRKSGSFAARAKNEEGAHAVDGEIKFELEDDETLRFSGNLPLQRRSKVRFAEELIDLPGDFEMADHSDSSSAEGGDKIPARLKGERYSAFVMALMRKRPEMSVVVCVKRCCSAMELWEETVARVEITPEKQDFSSPDHPRSLSSSPPGYIKADVEDEYLGFDGAADDLSPRRQGGGRPAYPHDEFLKQFNGYQKFKAENEDTDIAMDGAEGMEEKDGVKVDVMETST